MSGLALSRPGPRVTRDVVGSLGAHALTDIGNAQRFVFRHGADVRFVAANKQWFVFDGRRWAPDETREIERRIQDTAMDIQNGVALIEDADARTALRKWAQASEGYSRLKAMQACAEAIEGVTVLPSAFDADPWLLNVENGTLDLRTTKLRKHDRADMMTKVAPIVYDPDATCERWERFICEITGGRPELGAFLQRAFGYSLTGLTREQCLFLCYGAGANGKTVLLEIQRRIRGNYGAQADYATFVEQPVERPRPDIARLAGSRLVCAEEGREGAKLAESVVKALTGGSTITARYLYGREFEFQPTFKLWLAANHKPVIRATDMGMWRRVHLIPFDVRFEGANRDDELLSTLTSELPGILAWTVAGCKLWQQGGLAQPECVRAATAEYRADSDIVGEFLHECCAEGGEVAAGVLYQSYRGWADENGERAMTAQMFGRRLTERGLVVGLQRVAARPVKMRRGIHLLPIAVAQYGERHDYRSSGE